MGAEFTAIACYLFRVENAPWGLSLTAGLISIFLNIEYRNLLPAKRSIIRSHNQDVAAEGVRVMTKYLQRIVFQSGDDGYYPVQGN